MALRTEQKLPIILFVVFLTLTTIGFVFYQSTSSLQEGLRWQRDAGEAINRADDTARMASNINAGVFGFILTNNDSYLEPLQRAKQRIPQNVTEMRRLSGDSAGELAQIALLESALNELIAEAERKIDVRKREGRQRGYEEMTNVLDQPGVEMVQAAVRDYKGLVSERLRTREEGLDRGLASTIWILIGSSVAGILALALANFVVFTEIRKRHRAELELVDLNRGLEEKVRSRTAELEVMNDRLVEIGSEREILLLGEKRAREDAEVANRLRDEFMATVSHELRTPLNSILGWARMLKDGSLDHSQSERAVATIIKNSETQNRLIEDLLDVARLISGKLELAKDPVNVFDVVSHAIETSRPVANPKRIKIEFDHAGYYKGIQVCGDAARLGQVFSNLLTNAIKFSFEQGRVSVTLRQDGEEVVATVRDEGSGISKEFLPMVFERFRQDLNAPGRNGGLGLGLAIVRNLVEMHDGSVRASSQGENQGSTFEVRLPIMQD